MIPKVIHYCWFGRNTLPDSAQKCIASWRKFLPDHEIREWNEDNFDVNIIPYTQQAYEAKKYAFVSDYARFWILYFYGGLYFDTDVEIIKPMNDIIAQGAFMGIEANTIVNKSIENGGKSFEVNPGLGLGVTPKLELYKELLDYYKNEVFIHPDGTMNLKTIVTRSTAILKEHGFNGKNEIQKIGGVTIYPHDYFCPMDSTTGIVTITERSISIHHYDCSWLDHNTITFKLHLIKNFMFKLLGKRIVGWFYR